MGTCVPRTVSHKCRSPWAFAQGCAPLVYQYHVVPPCVELLYNDVLVICTGGSGIVITCCLRAGCGIYDPTSRIGLLSVTPCGREKSAQRADLAAVAHLLHASSCRVPAVTDNSYVAKGLKRVQHGAQEICAPSSLAYGLCPKNQASWRHLVQGALVGFWGAPLAKNVAMTRPMKLPTNIRMVTPRCPFCLQP